MCEREKKERERERGGERIKRERGGENGN